MRRTLRLAAVSLTVLIVVCLAAAFGLYRASQLQPDFYQQALQIEPEQHAVAGDELEKHVLDLHNDARHEGRWEATFTDQQINGWLAVDLPEKFPGLLPKGVLDPRVALQPDQVLLACQYEGEKFAAVISLALEVQLTDEPNVLAIRICKARAGALPLPLGKFLNQISNAARGAGLTLRWAQDEADPVALLTIPSQWEESHSREILVDDVQLRQGEVVLSGHTQRPNLAGLDGTRHALLDQSRLKRTRQR